MEKPAVIDWLEPDAAWELLRNGRRLGEGSFATAFLISVGDMKVCAKIFRDKASLPSMVEEAEALAVMSGVPHVPTLFCVTENPVGLVTSFGGRSLMKLIDRERLSRCHAVNIGLQIAESVQMIHQRGWTHNDIKDDNVVVKKNGFLLEATLIDFGNAARIGEATYGTDSITQITYPHIAPELFQGQTNSSKSDVYSIGYLLATIIPQEDQDEEVSLLIARAMNDNVDHRLSIDVLVQELREIHFNFFVGTIGDPFSALEN
ncbi:tyrosine-protein kinase Fgr-like [Oratosquilla oratoria]|uniref:tyrosine-protein kinase Fgr-like n=1 Tax=Oratosquilla oratoria TaxID=337810 RepID=UPI003F758937